MSSKVARKNIFVNLDFDNDARLKDALIGQGRYSNSPFEVRDYPVKEAAPQSQWRRAARRRMDLCSVVDVMCGVKGGEIMYQVGGSTA